MLLTQSKIRTACVSHTHMGLITTSYELLIPDSYDLPLYVTYAVCVYFAMWLIHYDSNVHAFRNYQDKLTDAVLVCADGITGEMTAATVVPACS